MVSAAAPDASTIHITAKLVTRSPIEAHSSNSEHPLLRNESVEKLCPIQLRTSYSLAVSLLDAGDLRAINSHSSPAWASRVSLPATKWHRPRHLSRLPRSRRLDRPALHSSLPGRWHHRLHP